VTLPIEIRKQLGLRPGTEVDLEVVGNSILIRKRVGTRGRALVSRMSGKATSRVATAKILALTRR
jgi:AbrB family looped-hinge helix DNA binding protein